jgi:hypothetical protein
MIEFKQSDLNQTRCAEIDQSLKKLDAEMASQNIKETKHAELNALYRQLSAEREVLSQRR